MYSASYDADGNMVTRNGSPITWTVDNLPESIGAAQGSSTFSYGPDGQRYYQSATDNGVTTDTTYIGSLFEVIAGQSSTEYRNNIFADGQVIAVHTIDQSGNATTSYLHYDHLGSVDTITNDQGTIAQQMSFDAFGLRRDAANWDYDLTTAQITALKDDTDRGYTFQEHYDPNHPYAVDSIQNSSGTTVYSASYDADGNMLTRNGSPLTWTADNLPASLASAQGGSTFSYDPEHQRYYQAATFNGATTDTTYIGGLFEVVATATTTDYRHNIIADGQVIAVHTIDQSGNATTRYLHYDHLGSVDTITDDQGTVAQSMSDVQGCTSAAGGRGTPRGVPGAAFDAFGLRRDPSNWDDDLTTAQITALKDDTDRGFRFRFNWVAGRWRII